LKNSKLDYRPEIDGLRALSVLAVILFHAHFESFSGGYIGVDVFFVISGYLITTIILKKLNNDSFSILDFYERRIRRIIPVLVLVCLATLPLAWFSLSTPQFVDYFESLIGAATFTSNFVFWQQSGYFDTASELKLLIHTWSLAVEEQYYIFFPLLLLVLWRIAPTRIFMVITGLCVISFLMGQTYVSSKPVTSFFLLPFRGWEIFIGAICAVLEFRNDKIIHNLSPSLSFLGLGMIIIPVFVYNGDTPTPSLYTLVPTTGAALVILFARQNPVSKFLSLRPLVFIGLISYSAYLWHQPLFAFSRQITAEALTKPVIISLIALTFLLSVFSWKFVEQPFRNQKISARLIWWSQPTLLMLLIGFGIAGITSNGFVANRSLDDKLIRENQLQISRSERQKLIKANICHYYDDQGISIDEFIENWDCRPKYQNGNQKRILIFGDSHAADKAAALKSVGIDAIQLTGAGCQITPKNVTPDRSHCLSLINFALTLKPEVDIVILSNKFPKNFDKSSIQNIIDYWSGWERPIVLFTPMPDFSVQHKQLLLDDKASAMPSFEKERSFLDIIRRINLGQNWTIINISDYVCPANKELDKIKAFQCRVYHDGKFIYTDETHWSSYGGRIFADELLKDARIQKLLFR